MFFLKFVLLKNLVVGLMFCMFMLIVFNVVGMEDDVVVVEFDDMRVVVLCVDGDGKFLSWVWFLWVRGGKFENLVDSGGRVTIVKGDEDVDVIVECFFFV